MLSLSPDKRREVFPGLETLLGSPTRERFALTNPLVGGFRGWLLLERLCHRVFPSISKFQCCRSWSSLPRLRFFGLSCCHCSSGPMLLASSSVCGGRDSNPQCLSQPVASKATAYTISATTAALGMYSPGGVSFYGPVSERSRATCNCRAMKSPRSGTANEYLPCRFL